MRRVIIMLAVISLGACDQSSKGYVPEDSLGIKRIDTSGRNDTMNYERMLQKTAPADSSSQTTHGRDTANYQSLPQKSLRKDSTSNR